MWTDAEAPGAMSPNEQPSVCVGAVPVIEHVPGPVYAGEIDQLMLGPPGSGSDSVTARAMPVPSASLFDTVTVKPIFSPAFTCASSAVLVIASSGFSTTIVAEASTDGALS